MRYLPAKIRDIADPALPVDQAEHRVATALRRVDDWSSIMVGDIVEAKRNAMVCQDVRDGDAEGGPRKLDEGEYGAYMTEAWRNFNIAEILKPASDSNRLSHVVLSCA